MNVGS